MERLSEWFDALQRREQMMVVAAGGALLLFVLFKLLWEPLAADIRELTLANQRDGGNLSWMLANSKQIRELSESGVAVEGIESMSIPEMLNTSTRQLNLQMSRLQPAESGEVQIWLDDVPFDKVARWVYQLESRYGLSIMTLNVNALEKAGRVNAQIRVR